MIIIINGSVGVGKTEASWELLSQLDNAFMLDGDHIGAVNPFEIYDQDRVDYLYQTFAHLISWHQEHSYRTFVINYVFEQPVQLAWLTETLEPLDVDIHCFWLTCDEDEQAKRIEARSVDHAWDLKRFVELNGIMGAASKTGSIGQNIDTTGKTIGMVANEILECVR